MHYKYWINVYGNQKDIKKGPGKQKEKVLCPLIPTPKQLHTGTRGISHRVVQREQNTPFKEGEPSENVAVSHKPGLTKVQEQQQKRQPLSDCGVVGCWHGTAFVAENPLKYTVSFSMTKQPFGCCPRPSPTSYKYPSSCPVLGGGPSIT